MSDIFVWLSEHLEILAGGLCVAVFVEAVLIFAMLVAFHKEKLRHEMMHYDIMRVDEVLRLVQSDISQLDDHRRNASYKLKNLYRDREDILTRLRTIEISLYDLPDDAK